MVRLVPSSPDALSSPFSRLIFSKLKARTKCTPLSLFHYLRLSLVGNPAVRCQVVVVVPPCDSHTETHQVDASGALDCVGYG